MKKNPFYAALFFCFSFTPLKAETNSDPIAELNINPQQQENNALNQAIQDNVRNEKYLTGIAQLPFSALALSMDANKIEFVGVPPDNTKKEAILSDNVTRVGNEGAVYIANGLVRNNTLQILSLVGNQIGPDGIKAIAVALSNNNTLKHLVLANNMMGDEGAHALAELLKKNTTLETLVLAACGITDEGAEILASSLKTNRTLRVIVLAINPIQNKGMASLVEARTVRKTPLNVDLRNPLIKVGPNREAIIEAPKPKIPPLIP